MSTPNPLIPLSVTTATPVTAQQEARQGQIRNQLLEAQTAGVTSRTAGAEEERGVARAARDQRAVLEGQFRNIARGVNELSPLLDAAIASGDTTELIQALETRREGLLADPSTVDTQDTDQTLQMVMSGQLQGVRSQFDEVQETEREFDRVRLGLPAERASDVAATRPGFSARSTILEGGLVQQTDNRGNIFVTTAAGEVLTGQDAQDAVDAAEEAETARKTREIQEGAQARTKATRTSEIKQEFSTRRRDAARSQIGLNQAMQVVDKATQGVAGASKLALARLLPGIDVTNEAILDTTLTSLSLDQLQRFKGPTTDFEFRVTESISGAIGDPRSANKARINSLSRNNWFMNRESEQFNKWIADNKDPDEFAFNFGERIKTNKGEFSLRDLQDTAIAKRMDIDEVLRELNK